LDREIEHARTLQPYSARHKWSRPSWLLQCLVLTRRRYREKYNNIPKTIGPFIILGFIGFILSSYVCAIFKRLPAYSDTHQFSLSLSLSLSLSCDIDHSGSWITRRPASIIECRCCSTPLSCRSCSLNQSWHSVRLSLSLSLSLSLV